MADAEVLEEQADRCDTSGLLELADVRLTELLATCDGAASSTLDAVMRRLFDPQNVDRSPISGFGSSL